MINQKVKFDNLVTITIKAGTIVDINGIASRLKNDTEIEINWYNIEKLNSHRKEKQISDKFI